MSHPEGWPTALSLGELLLVSKGDFFGNPRINLLFEPRYAMLPDPYRFRGFAIGNQAVPVLATEYDT